MKKSIKNIDTSGYMWLRIRMLSVIMMSLGSTVPPSAAAAQTPQIETALTTPIETIQTPRITTTKAPFTIERCIELARSNYPILSKLDLIAQERRLNLQNVKIGWIPQVSLSGRATWQSAVTQLPLDFSSLPIPGLPAIPRVSRDQYQVAAELTQVVWDGGAMRAASAGVRALGETNRAQVEVELYVVRERVAEIFFGILAMDKQLILNANYEADLKAALDRTAAAEAHGAAGRSDLDAVEVELVALGQRTTELRATVGAYRDVLATMMGVEGGSDELWGGSEGSLGELVAPTIESFICDDIYYNKGPGGAGTHPTTYLSPSTIAHYGRNSRPELALFEARAGQIDAARKVVKARGMPILGLFVQGGYGRPGLDMLSDKFTTFAIGGARFSWNFGGLYNRGREMKNLDIQRRGVEIARDNFLFNNDLQWRQLVAVFKKFDRILADDTRLVELRGSIRAASEARVASGVATTTDLMRDVRAEQNADTQREMHRIEMVMTLWKINNLLNN